MKEEIYSRHPDLFQGRSACEWPRGWDGLVGTLVEMIAEEVKASNLTNFKILQAKTKFAGLRFYTVGGNDRTGDLIRLACQDSYRICEGCGKDGHEFIKGGWVSTVCPECEERVKRGEYLG